MLKEVLLSLCLGGCAYPKIQIIKISLEPKPRQNEALKIVWDYFAEWSDQQICRTPPTIAWTNTESFPCLGGWCFGMYMKNAHLALIGWRGSFSRSSFAHEICHVWFDDSNHNICINGLPPIETANKRLSKNGL